MTLSTISIDEAIALACREVTGCMSDPAWQDRPSVYWPATPEDDARMTDTSHAVWFDAAHEWLMNASGEVRIEQCGSGFRCLWPTCGPDGQWFIQRSDVYSTKYHALAEAVLLAAGKVVP